MKNPTGFLVVKSCHELLEFSRIGIWIKDFISRRYKRIKADVDRFFNFKYNLQNPRETKTRTISGKIKIILIRTICGKNKTKKIRDNQFNPLKSVGNCIAKQKNHSP